MSGLQPIIGPVIRTCRDCERAFEITAEEIAAFQRLAQRTPAGEQGIGWHLPSRCRECRAARRAAKYGSPVDARAGDEWLTCRDCGTDFIFGGKDRDFFARHGWMTPTRCRPCRERRRGERHGHEADVSRLG
jgi:hypothetical protein